MSQIAKMAERSFADRVLPVTALIYRNGEEKPAIGWSFEIGIGGEMLMLFFELGKDLESQIGVAS